MELGVIEEDVVSQHTERRLLPI